MKVQNVSKVVFYLPAKLNRILKGEGSGTSQRGLVKQAARCNKSLQAVKTKYKV